MTSSSARAVLREMYRRLWRAYGPQNWWPAQTPTEVVIGAILTQNTAWTNVEQAIANLRAADCLTWAALRELSPARLAELIRPAGTYRVKTKRLKAFVEVLWRDHGGRLEDLLGGELDQARDRLRRIHGLGPETADAILLYAGDRPTFVIDAYTRRVLGRHGLIDPAADYETVRRLFHESITPEVRVYNEYHALLVAVGKRHCRRTPRCAGCPLEPLPHDTDPA